MNNKSGWSNFLFALLVLGFIFQPPLEYIFGPLKFFDELYAIAFIPLLCFMAAEEGYVLTLKGSTIWMVVLLALFSVCGLVGTFSNHYQPLGIAGLDWFLHMKFFFAMATTFILFRKKKTESLYCSLWPVVQGVVIFLFVTVVADIGLHIFPATYRLGMRAEAIFYGIPTNLAAISFFLIGLLFRLYEYKKDKVVPYLGMLALIIFTTMRAKALGGLIFAAFLFFSVVRKRRGFGPITWIVSASGISLIAATQFVRYYMSDNFREARNILTLISMRIAKEYFPFGTGYATFGSAYSADPYSKVYYLYHINRIWGISKEYSSFISDTFWPMIVGQSGFLGLLFYLILILVLAGKILSLRKGNVYTYASAIVVFVYLLISSTSESSFANPMSIPLAVLIGMAFVEQYQKGEFT